MTRPFRDRGEEKEHGAVPFLLYKENPVLDTGFVEAMRLNNNFPTVKLKSRSGNCNKV